MIWTSSQAESRQEPVPQRERLLAGLHSRLHTDDVADLALHHLIQSDQKIHRALGLARHFGEKGREHGDYPASISRNGRNSRAAEAVVGKGILFRVRLQEEVERIVDRHFGNQIHLHG